MSLFDDLTDLLDSGQAAAMVTVVGTEGSTPRDAGARMLVTEESEYGTIGGGTVEGLAIESARAVLAGEESAGVRSYELERGGNTGMVCGGRMEVFVDRIGGGKRLYVAGGGHIGTELAALADQVGYAVTVVDDREEYADPERFPDGVTVTHGDYGTTLSGLPIGAETAVVSATRGNTFDQDAVAAALDADAGYVGVVASDTKTEHIVDSLVSSGYSRRSLASVRAPIGLDVGGGSPADIALAILAEVNLDRHGASGGRASRLALDGVAVIRGGGDLGSGVAYRLHQAGYPVVVTDVPEPTVVRRAVAFGTAVYDGEVTVEGVRGRRASDVDEAVAVLADGDVAVLVDPEAAVAAELDATLLVDAILAKGKHDTGTRRDDADVVVGLGPGFEARADATDEIPASDDTVPVDAVVETDRGHRLGRVFYEGTASAYDGIPGEREGVTTERVLRAPAGGRWERAVGIGDVVEAGDVTGFVDDTPVPAAIDGLVRGLIHDGLDVTEGTKLGDVDPRGDAIDHEEISDKALCLGGGVLEAMLRLG